MIYSPGDFTWTSPTILDSDFRYIDKKGNLLKTRTELTVAQMLIIFLKKIINTITNYIKKWNRSKLLISKQNKGYDRSNRHEEDIEKYKKIKEDFSR